jgi:very-short-patch-repair endonuclease
MSWNVLSRADLLIRGMTSRDITRSVRSGEIIRARQGHYLHHDAPSELVQAVRIGGRLGCVSLLAVLGVFVWDSSRLYVHMERGDSRMRAANSPHPLAPRAARPEVLHWHTLTETPTPGTVHIIDAIVHAARCQAPQYTVATLDSVLNLGLLEGDQVADVFAALPRRFRALRPHLDGRAQSGTETLVRLLLLRLGHQVELQVRFDGVGYVDLLVDGWLVVECDSREFHSSWAQQRKDYQRDLALAARGYPVLRITAEDILYRPESVTQALKGLLGPRG